MDVEGLISCRGQPVQSADSEAPLRVGGVKVEP